MAKNPANVSTVPAAVAAVDAAAAGVKEITVPPGGALAVIVDVGPMTIPYTVAYAGRTVVKSLVDRAETVPLTAGTQFLSWAFAHTAKSWKHTIGFSINGGAFQELEARSEAQKHPDHSVGFAVVKA